MGVTFASFQISGNMAVDKILLKIILRGNTTDSSHKRSMCGDIPSDPEALLGFNWRINEIISLFPIAICSILSFVRNPKAGKILPFITGLHC